MTVRKKKSSKKSNFVLLLTITVFVLIASLFLIKTKSQNPKETLEQTNKINIPEDVVKRFVNQPKIRSERFLLNRNTLTNLELFSQGKSYLISGSGEKPIHLQRLSPDGNYIAYVRFDTRQSDNYSEKSTYYRTGKVYLVDVSDLNDIKSKVIYDKFLIQDFNPGDESRLVWDRNSKLLYFRLYSIAKKDFQSYVYNTESGSIKSSYFPPKPWAGDNPYPSMTRLINDKYIMAIKSKKPGPMSGLGMNLKLVQYDVNGSLLNTYYDAFQAQENEFIYTGDFAILIREFFPAGTTSDCYVELVDFTTNKTYELAKRACPPGQSGTRYLDPKLSPDNHKLIVNYSEDRRNKKEKTGGFYSELLVIDFDKLTKQIMAKYENGNQIFNWISNNEVLVQNNSDYVLNIATGKLTPTDKFNRGYIVSDF